MQTSNRLFDDLAKVANGAASTLNTMKSEVEGLVRQQIEKILVDSDMVARDEFEAARAVAVEARLQQEKLEKRVSELEAKLAAAITAKPGIRTKKTATAKKPQKKTAR